MDEMFILVGMDEDKAVNQGIYVKLETALLYGKVYNNKAFHIERWCISTPIKISTFVWHNCFGGWCFIKVFVE